MFLSTRTGSKTPNKDEILVDVGAQVPQDPSGLSTGQRSYEFVQT